MCFRLGVLATVAIFIAIAISGPALAFTPKVGLDVGGAGASVTINGRVAIRFQASNGALSATERATITAERLRQLIGKVVPAAIGAKGTKLQGRIYAGDTLVCVATKLDARANHTMPLMLASDWAARIKALLLMPPIVLSDYQVTVPLGENKSVQVGGAATGPITATSSAGEIASASPGEDGRYIQIAGLSLGTSTVQVGSEGEFKFISVYVKKYAGSVPGSAFAEVTGSPCPISIVGYAAAQAALRSSILEPGAQVSIENVTGNGTPLTAGLSRQASVSVRITGPNYITYLGQTNVEVHNSVVPRDDVEQLFYSNSPERLLKYQTLFAGKLELDKSTRILYHHQNAIGKSARFVVELINPNDSPAVFRVYRGTSEPMVDTVLVGYMASKLFLWDQFYNASVIERIPPKSRILLVCDLLRYQETSSGLLQIKQTDGQQTYIRVAAVPPALETSAVGSIFAASEAPALEMSNHVYANPAKVVEASYVVGKHWAFISIGKLALESHDTQKKLYGNYGVTYQINVKIENPTSDTKKVMVMFDPRAGLASGVFIIDGEFVYAKYAKPPNEVPLATYRLQPGEIRNLRILTSPVAGSNYPAALIVRS